MSQIKRAVGPQGSVSGWAGEPVPQSDRLHNVRVRCKRKMWSLLKLWRILRWQQRSMKQAQAPGDCGRAAARLWPVWLAPFALVKEPSPARLGVVGEDLLHPLLQGSSGKIVAPCLLTSYGVHFLLHPLYFLIYRQETFRNKFITFSKV